MVTERTASDNAPDNVTQDNVADNVTQNNVTDSANDNDSENNNVTDSDNGNDNAADTAYSFHGTARGASHIERNTPCEDASDAFSDPSGRFHVAAVADGHGDPRCFRSQDGAKFAVKIAVDFLKEIASDKLSAPDNVRQRFFYDLFSNSRYRQIELRRWTDILLRRWNQSVRDDYDNRPPTPADLEWLSPRLRDNVPHMYGTTLLAALWLPPALILLQQGDGRCVTLSDGAEIRFPVPWDSRCEGNVTTSLCDPDAPESFRFGLLDLRAIPVDACYLLTDGVEDAFRDTYSGFGGNHALMGGVRTFCEYLSAEASQRSAQGLSDFLPDFLKTFSARGLYGYGGSWDDVSAAGIARPDRLSQSAEAFRRDVKIYGLEEDLFWKNDALRSGARKHEILARRMSEARERLEAAKKLYGAEERPETDNAEKAESDNVTELQELERVCSDAEAKFTEYDAKYQATTAERDRIQAELSAMSGEDSAFAPDVGEEQEL